MRNALLAGCLLLGACDRGVGLAATEVLNNTDCKGAADGIRKVSYADVAGLRGSMLLSMSAPDTATDQTGELVLISLSKGRQPTPGYGFRLDDVRLRERVATIEFSWFAPAPESAQAQVITYPCLVVGIEPADFDTVRAVDGDGELLGELRI